MHDFYLRIFIIIWDATFFLSPLSSWIVQRQYPKFSGRARKVFFAVSFVLIALALVILLTPWSFRGLIADAVFLSLAYFAYGALMWLVSFKPRALSGILVFVLWGIPTAIGILLGVTLLGLLFVLGDISPRQVGKLGPNYSYRILTWGGAVAPENDTNVKIFYSPALLPFLEYQVGETTFRWIPKSFAEMSISRTGNQIAIRCPRIDGNSTDTRLVSVR